MLGGRATDLEGCGNCCHSGDRGNLVGVEAWLMMSIVNAIMMGLGGALVGFSLRGFVQRRKAKTVAKEVRSSTTRTSSNTIVPWMERGECGEPGVFNGICPACKQKWFWRDGTPDSCSCEKHDELHFHLVCIGNTKFGCGYEWTMKAATQTFKPPMTPYRTSAGDDKLEDVAPKETRG